jgi:LmbE family N-acetylglucosaminyl deacetylase
MDRREIIKSAGILSAAPFLSGDLGFRSKKDETRIIVAGGHPDDPETGCGGTIAYLAEQGHHVTALYLTKGEAGIPGTPLDAASNIRMEEAEEACLILNAHPVFFGQVDGETFVNRNEYMKMHDIIRDLQPNVVFTQWPVDTHPDHRIISLLIYDAWLKLDKNFSLYYYEVMTGEQSQLFHPSEYVDITGYVDIKKKACMAHKSQKPEEWYVSVHERMSLFRGLESGCKHAEAFVRHPHQNYMA